MRTKDVQGKLWSAAPSDWATYLEPSFIPMYEAVLEKLPLGEGKKCSSMPAAARDSS